MTDKRFEEVAREIDKKHAPVRMTRHALIKDITKALQQAYEKGREEERKSYEDEDMFVFACPAHGVVGTRGSREEAYCEECRRQSFNDCKRRAVEVARTVTERYLNGEHIASAIEKLEIE